MLVFASTFILAAACLLVHAGVPPEVMTTCNMFGVHRLSCDFGVIEVQSVLSGWKDTVTCSEGRRPPEVRDCALNITVEVVKKRCDGKMVCEFSQNVFSGYDPCVGSFKYLQTRYSCIPAVHRVVCEHSVAHLQCGEGEVIAVRGADYGRRDATTCSDHRSEIQLHNTHCSLPTDVVADRCNGRNSCAVQASNSVFGDPCQGTYKYLELAYTCQYANQEGAL